MHLKEILNPEDFWQYSIATYQLPEVKELCLLCQEQFNVNVNVILLCGWLHGFGKTLDVEQLEKLLTEIEDSQIALKVLRGLRNDCKKGSEAYKAYLREELEHEALQQQQLLNALANCSSLHSGAHPLTVYFKLAQCEDTVTLESLPSGNEILRSLISNMEAISEDRDDDCNI